MYCGFTTGSTFERSREVQIRAVFVQLAGKALYAFSACSTDTYAPLYVLIVIVVLFLHRLIERNRPFVVSTPTAHGSSPTYRYVFHQAASLNVLPTIDSAKLPPQYRVEIDASCVSTCLVIFAYRDSCHTRHVDGQCRRVTK